MNTLRFDLTKKVGSFKPLNAVNNGPVGKSKTAMTQQNKSNFDAYKDARIPYARNHDAAFYGAYGGEYTVDISAIFPNFDADVNDPASYQFTVTDKYVLDTLEAGTETFYRLGQKIEHYVKKFHIYPPKDLKKWAAICEHIIRHYNEGWANGFELGIKYWEIWNEPDLNEGDENRPTWGGTRERFFDLYEITAKHLKSCFPNLKIGGPALAHNLKWAEDFLKQMKERNVPIDFFSWHIYCTTPAQMKEKSDAVKKLLVDNGYENTESILNEWNYVKEWSGEEYLYSMRTILGMKGAAFVMACMSMAQSSSIDMLMYYDARPTVWNGMFDLYFLQPLKGYYPFYWYGMLYDMEAEVRSENEIEDIYTLCGVDKDGKAMCIVTYYTDDNNCIKEKPISIDFGREGRYEIYLLDEIHNAEFVRITDNPELLINPNTCILIKEI